MKNRRLTLLALMAPFAWASGYAVAQSTTPDTPAATMSTAPASPSTAVGSSPATEVGGYRPTTQPSPEGGIRFGAFTISPAVSAVYGRDDNVTLRSTNKISSAFIGLSPGVTVVLPGPTQRYSARYAGNYGRYESSSRDNYDDHAVGLDANNEWSTRLRTLLRYDFFRGHDPRGATATATAADAPDRWDTNALRGTVAYGAKGAKGIIEVDAGLGTKRYLTNRDVTQAKDYDQQDLAGTFYYRVGAATQALVQIRGSDIGYKTNTALDSTEMRYYGGLKWDATAKTQGMVKFGYMTKKFSDASRPNSSNPSYEAGVTWSPLTYSVVNLNAIRTFGEQTSGGNYILTDNVSVLWNHDWSSRVRSTLALAHGRDVHEGLNRTDTRDNLGLKATYGFRRWLRVGGEVKHEARDSNVPNVDYKRNLMLITLDATL